MPDKNQKPYLVYDAETDQRGVIKPQQPSLQGSNSFASTSSSQASSPASDPSQERLRRTFQQAAYAAKLNYAAKIKEGNKLVIKGRSNHTEKKMSEISREEVKAMIEASEARNDTKFERLLSEIKLMRADFVGEGTKVTARFDVLTTKLDSVGNLASSTKSNIWAATAVIVASIAIIVAVVFVIGPWAFSTGAQVRDMVHNEAEAQKPKAP